jgi:hypothetical protein
MHMTDQQSGVAICLALAVLYLLWRVAAAIEDIAHSMDQSRRRIDEENEEGEGWKRG